MMCKCSMKYIVLVLFYFDILVSILLGCFVAVAWRVSMMVTIISVLFTLMHHLLPYPIDP